MAAHRSEDGWHVVRLDRGEAFPADVLQRLGEARVEGGVVSAIGAFERATLTYYDTAAGRYLDLPVEEQVEVVSLSGNVATLDDGRPFAHVHAALSRRDGTVIAGHLREGIVNPTLEVFVHAIPGRLRRVLDPATGLGRLDLER